MCIHLEWRKENEKKKYNFTAFCGDPMNNSTKSSNSGGKLRLERGTYRALCVVLWGSQRRCDEDKQSSSGVRRAFPVLFCPPWPMFFHRTHFRAFPQFPVGISCHHEADSVVQTVWSWPPRPSPCGLGHGNSVVCLPLLSSHQTLHHSWCPKIWIITLWSGVEDKQGVVENFRSRAKSQKVNNCSHCWVHTAWTFC